MLQLPGRLVFLSRPQNVVPPVLSQNVASPYPASVPARDSMAYWIGKACEKARRKAGISEGRMAVEVKRPKRGKDEVNVVTILRFEKGREGWPRLFPELFRTYVEQTGENPFELWEEALRLWRDYRGRPHGVNRLAEGLDQAPPADADAAKPEGRDEPHQAA